MLRVPGRSRARLSEPTLDNRTLPSPFFTRSSLSRLADCSPFAACPPTCPLHNATPRSHKIDAYMTCLASKVPAETDLFLIDAATVPQTLRSAEQVVRSLLALPKAPAVLFIHFTNCRRAEAQTLSQLRLSCACVTALLCTSSIVAPFDRCPLHCCLHALTIPLLSLSSACGKGCWHAEANSADVKKEHQNRSCYMPPRAVARWRQSSENEVALDELASYYSLPSLSLRRAFGRAALRAVAEQFFRPWELTMDGLHPQRMGCNTVRNPDGCKNERYAQLSAALVNTYLWDAWSALQREEQAVAGLDEGVSMRGIGGGGSSGGRGDSSNSSDSSRSSGSGGSGGSSSGRITSPRISDGGANASTSASFSTSTALPLPYESTDRARLQSARLRLEAAESGRLRPFPCLSFLPPHYRPGTDGGTERCFAWGEGLKARPEKSLAPLLPGSSGVRTLRVAFSTRGIPMRGIPREVLLHTRVHHMHTLHSSHRWQRA